jgi:hypothetical protein
MKSEESLGLNPGQFGQNHSHSGGSSAALSALHLVSSQDLQALRDALDRGQIPSDLQAKLARLAGDSLTHHFIERNSRLFIALLLAVQDGSFRGGTPTQRERLLQVLAYVRKDDDAIPDSKPGGFADDHQEVRAATAELEQLLEEFKRWRLRHQVPKIWMDKLCRARGIPTAGAGLLGKARIVPA